MSDDEIDRMLRVSWEALKARPRVVPRSTYRLQFHKGFTFRDAAAIVPYLAKLGVSHCYASPYFQAAPGSTHGYDVVDHARLNRELGTADDFEAWIAAMRHAGMSQIADIVPNHMGVDTNENRLWNDVLEAGLASPYARFFDIAWHASPREELKRRVLLPVLGAPYGDVLQNGELQLVYEEGRLSLAYYERRFPIAIETYADVLGESAPEPSLTSQRDAELNRDPQAWAAQRRAIQEELAAKLSQATVEARLAAINGTAGDPASFDALDAILARQHYRLACWRTAADEINYRRFFDVIGLAALSMERADVFAEAHEAVFRLLVEGKLAGLRIDHSDGLYDPAAYFQRLQRAYVVAHARAGMTPLLDLHWLNRAEVIFGDDDVLRARPLYLVCEKILAAGEPLPSHWAIDGTTGYDALNEINGVFVDRDGVPTLDATYRRFVPDAADYVELAYRQKRKTLLRAFAGELNLLAHQLDAIAQRSRRTRDFTLNALRGALCEVIACFDVYRTYVAPERGAGDRDTHDIDAAVGEARRRSPTLDSRLLNFLRDVLLLRGSFAGNLRAESAQFAAKFQQLTSPVTAKGLEDTAFYIHHRLISVNEVGGDPDRVGLETSELHERFRRRQRNWPGTMTVLSTHDTKRSEDVRARINVLSELAEEWSHGVERWHAINQPVAVHPNDEYLLYQTLVGAWPLGDVDEAFGQRIVDYLRKAMREAKQRTSWTAPDESVEAAMEAFVRRLLDSRQSKAFLAAFKPFQQRVAATGMINSLAQTLLKLTAPGVPDTYQGTELWDFSLVDPDNRRPVDYALREQFLQSLHSARSSDLFSGWRDGRVKLLVTTRALRLRLEMPSVFLDSEYVPLSVAGAGASRLFAFARMDQDGNAVVSMVPRLIAAHVGPEMRIDWSDTRLILPPRLSSRGWVDVFTGRCFESGEAVPVGRILDELPVALWRSVQGDR